MIVYGSFRSLNMEREARERQEREKEAAGLLGTTTTTPHTPNSMYLQCIFMKSTAKHAFWELFYFFTIQHLLLSKTNYDSHYFRRPDFGYDASVVFTPRSFGVFASDVLLFRLYANAVCNLHS